jgi:integrase
MVFRPLPFLRGTREDGPGATSLGDLERMTDEVAGFAASLPDRYRYSVMSAFRQTCAGGIRYGYMTANPAKLSGKNPAPPPHSVRVFSPAEIKALCAEFDTRGAAAITFAAATGLRPSEWAHVERRDSIARGTSHGARDEDEAVIPRGAADGRGTPGARLARRPSGFALRLRRS